MQRLIKIPKVCVEWFAQMLIILAGKIRGRLLGYACSRSLIDSRRQANPRRFQKPLIEYIPMEYNGEKVRLCSPRKYLRTRGFFRSIVGPNSFRAYVGSSTQRSHMTPMVAFCLGAATADYIKMNNINQHAVVGGCRKSACGEIFSAFAMGLTLRGVECCTTLHAFSPSFCTCAMLSDEFGMFALTFRERGVSGFALFDSKGVLSRYAYMSIAELATEFYLYYYSDYPLTRPGLIFKKDVLKVIPVHDRFPEVKTRRRTKKPNFVKAYKPYLSAAKLRLIGLTSMKKIRVALYETDSNACNYFKKIAQTYHIDVIIYSNIGLKSFREKLCQSDVDFGIAFWENGARITAYDRCGNSINEETMLAMMCEVIMRRCDKLTVYLTVTATHELEEYLSGMGARVGYFKEGSDTIALARGKHFDKGEGMVLGSDGSIAFKSCSYMRDGLLCSLLLCAWLSRKRKAENGFTSDKVRRFGYECETRYFKYSGEEYTFLARRFIHELKREVQKDEKLELLYDAPKELVLGLENDGKVTVTLSDARRAIELSSRYRSKALFDEVMETITKIYKSTAGNNE